MDNYIKLNSVNAGPFNNQQNIVEFEIPQGVWNLRDSYLQYNIPLASTDADYPILPCNLNWRDDDGNAVNYKVPNVALIRDASIVCDRKGRIEDIRRVDQLRTNMRAFSKSCEVKESESYLAMNKFNDLNNQGYNYDGIYSELNKTGDIESKMNDIVPVQIRLNDIFDFCNTPEFDTTKAGNTRIRTRLNLDRLRAEELALSLHWQYGGDADIGLCEDNAFGGDRDNNDVAIKCKLKDESQWPYYVGQTVRVSATGAGGAASPANVTSRISDITFTREGADAGTLELAFVADWGAALTAGQSYTDITLDVIRPPAGGPASPGQPDGVVNVQYAEIVLRQVARPQGLDEISFNTYSTEQTQGGNAQVYRNLFQLEPESSNVMIMFPVNGLISQNNNLSNYSLRLNNEDLIDDRSVEIGEPIYFDRLNLAYQNLGTGLNCLFGNVGTINQNVIGNGRYAEDTSNVQIIAQPVMASSNEKLLQVELNSSAGDIDKITLFKELPRIFSY